MEATNQHFSLCFLSTEDLLATVASMSHTQLFAKGYTRYSMLLDDTARSSYWSFTRLRKQPTVVQDPQGPTATKEGNKKVTKMNENVTTLDRS